MGGWEKFWGVGFEMKENCWRCIAKFNGDVLLLFSVSAHNLKVWDAKDEKEYILYWSGECACMYSIYTKRSTYPCKYIFIYKF
jgi:hypothetical protein